MILKASQRGGGLQLARHLMNISDNDHVELHDMRGFIAGNLEGALKEAYAVSRGTRCRQFLFSVSLNPPEMERVPINVFEAAIAEIEERMGLIGQPRAIVFHEKEGRRHAHAVWSRIDANQMKAINLPHFKLKLRDISRQLYLDHGWKMPHGLMNSEARNPLNFSLAEWQQARRAKADPRLIKETLQECWAVSDSRQAFEGALSERGYHLAQGDRRGHVIVDWRGDIYSLSRWVGLRSKEVSEKLGKCDDLPTVDEVKARVAATLADKLNALATEESERHNRAKAALLEKKNSLVSRQRTDRLKLREHHANRRIAETRSRASQLPRSVKAIWWRITGKWKEAVRQFEREAQLCNERDDREHQTLVKKQLSERRALQLQMRALRDQQALSREILDRDAAQYLSHSNEKAVDVHARDNNAPTSYRNHRSRPR